MPSQTSDMKSEIDYLKRFKLHAGVLTVILAIYVLLLIASRVFVGQFTQIQCPKIFWRCLTAFTVCI